MGKSTTPYWNVFAPDAEGRWTPIKGLEGMAEELTLSMDIVAPAKFIFRLTLAYR